MLVVGHHKIGMSDDGTIRELVAVGIGVDDLKAIGRLAECSTFDLARQTNGQNAATGAPSLIGVALSEHTREIY